MTELIEEIAWQNKRRKISKSVTHTKQSTNSVDDDNKADEKATVSPSDMIAHIHMTLERYKNMSRILIIH